MNTRLTDEIFIDTTNEKDRVEKEYKEKWKAFLLGDKETDIEKVFEKVKSLLKKDRWVVMQDEMVYDNEIKACWL